jgi:hypothetical protein
MHSDDDVEKPALSLVGEHCNYKDFSDELLIFGRGGKPTIKAAFRLLNMEETMQTLLKNHHTLEDEIEAANKNIRSVRFRQKGLMSRTSKFETQKRTEINAEVEKMKMQFADLKRAILTVLKALMFECGGSFDNKR